MNHFHDKLLTRDQAADFLGVKTGTLAVWSCNKRYGLPFIKVGRLVRYKQSDLETFLENRRQNRGMVE